MSQQKIWIGTVKELAQNPMKHFEIKGRHILVSRVGDAYYATSNTCTHEEFSLSEGTLDDRIVTCPAHGAQFDVRTGEVKAFPAVRPLPVYRLEIAGEDMYIILENHTPS